MRHFITMLLGLLVTCSSLAPLHAQKLYVLNNGGQQSEYTISAINKLYFSTGELIIEMEEGSNQNYLLDDIRYLNFTDLVQIPEPTIAQRQEIILFPNPVEETLHIRCALPGNSSLVLEIFSPDGRLVYRKTGVGQNEMLTFQVRVQAIPPGLYFCRVYSEKTTITKKFIKK